jgi:hypothetical protein
LNTVSADWTTGGVRLSTVPESLSSFIDEAPTSDKSLLLVNRTGPKPLADLLTTAFATQPISVAERHVPEGTDDLVCLIEDGRVVATSAFERLRETFLLVNVDRYRTGARPVETDRFPDVLTDLTETTFTVAGFPASNKEKLLLVVISRFIEHLALSVDGGRLDTTFQRLSRLDDEYGTRQMYELLGDSGVDTHVYGRPDDPEAVGGLDVVVHTGDTDPYRRSWVVAFTPGETSPGDSDDPTHAALVARETGPNVWRGMWTYDATRVSRLNSYIDAEF